MFSMTAPNPGAEFVIYRYCMSEAALTSYSDSQLVRWDLGYRSFLMPIFPPATDPIRDGPPKLGAIGWGRHTIMDLFGTQRLFPK
jgi:hypothetical protein